MSYSIQLSKNNITISNINLNDGTPYKNVISNVTEEDRNELIDFLNKSKIYYFGLNISLTDPGPDAIKISDSVSFNKGIYYVNNKATNVYDKYGNIYEAYKDIVYQKHLYVLNKKLEEEKNNIQLNVNNKINKIKEENDEFYTNLTSFYFKLKIFFIILITIIVCIIIYIKKNKIIDLLKKTNGTRI